MRQKSINVSKTVRLRRPPKPELALTGIVTGLFAGEAIGVIIEVAASHPNRWIMLGGGAVGIALGSLVEGGRYCWRRYKWRAATKP